MIQHEWLGVPDASDFPKPGTPVSEVSGGVLPVSGQRTDRVVENMGIIGGDRHRIDHLPAIFIQSILTRRAG